MRYPSQDTPHEQYIHQVDCTGLLYHVSEAFQEVSVQVGISFVRAVVMHWPITSRSELLVAIYQLECAAFLNSSSSSGAAGR